MNRRNFFKLAVGLPLVAFGVPVQAGQDKYEMLVSNSRKAIVREMAVAFQVPEKLWRYPFPLNKLETP